MKRSLPASAVSLAFAFAFALVGCDSPAEPDLDRALNADIATVAAEMALDELAQGTLWAGALGAPPTSAAQTQTPGARVVSSTVTYFDQHGAPMASFHPLLTAAIRIQRSVEREGSRDGWTASVSRSSDVTISGLLGVETERTWNGTANGQVTRSRFSDERGTRTYDMTYTSVTTNVVRAVDREAHPWPLSGSIAHEITAARTDREGNPVTRQRSAVLTFNGTQFATLTVGGETFEVDLASREGRGPLIRRR